jgi:iron complex transport system ATP-binding protein
MNKPAIDIENLRITAGKRIILDLPRLVVESNEVFTVIGPNGAGKSTLLKSCLGLIRPSGGKIEVLGEAVHTLRGATLSHLRRRIGYVAQEQADRCEMPLTVREVVAIGRTGIAGLFRPLKGKDWWLVDEWIERLGLGTLARQAFSDLSGGEQRKTLIARAMVQQPELLILDEPTAHLDLGWREQIVDTLGSLYEQTHITVLLVCHEMEVIPPCGQRMALLEDGHLAACGQASEILTDQRVAALYGPGLAVQHHGGRHAVVPGQGSSS